MTASPHSRQEPGNYYWNPDESINTTAPNYSAWDPDYALQFLTTLLDARHPGQTDRSRLMSAAFDLYAGGRDDLATRHSYNDVLEYYDLNDGALESQREEVLGRLEQGV